MQELVGKLEVLDPGASNSLKVIEYFDVLVDGHATPQTLLRGAAFLSGVTAGVESPRVTFAVDERGRLLAGARPDTWSTRALQGGGVVWIQRAGARHANDDMILERLAIGLGIALERAAPPTESRLAVDTVIDRSESVDSRREAALRLRLDPAARYSVIAEPARVSARAGHQTTVVTSVGAVRAIVRLAADPVREPRAGVGLPAASDALDRSWTSALTALRLTSDSEPIVRAADLGAFLLVAEVADSGGAPSDDVTALAALLTHSEQSLTQLESLVAADSLRAAAAAIGIHHSTLQVQATRFSTALGFDVRSPQGRLRLALALKLHRLATTRFT
ncbi:helix-turn-helix domain-containing protein [uncultured Amnibacterium sp.]|uniref:helix-turn-helix domain-containing protein n=1 Tax=uncultured Amnibacterium sp. TaxID=1631851 RepID=UPI0035CCA29B